MRDIIITGIPRSGTTLVAATIDGEKNSVCLNEPEWQHPSPALDAQGFAAAIAADFDHVRGELLAGNPVPDRRASDGSALTNYFGDETNFTTYPLVRKGLSPDFTLAMKHNGPYLSVLPELIALGRFEIRAVIRHPLPVLRSWRRLSLPVSRGDMPNANAYWLEMKAITAANMPLLEKQARMIDAMFARIAFYEKDLTLLRYEDVAKNKTGQTSAQPTQDDDAIIQMLKKVAPQALRYYPS